MANLLYYGDNLDILRRYVADESVDLIYLDPPFKSDQSYNILFAERDGARSAAQIRAFTDTWTWTEEAAAAYADVVARGERLSDAMQAMWKFLGPSDMMAYLAMMAPRLMALRRVLKPTGSIYLHCDPAASHYLKLLMDAVFAPLNFKNEIIWKRTGSHNSAQRFGPVHDAILYYGKSDKTKWYQQRQSYGDTYKTKFGKIDPVTSKPFQDVALTGPGIRTGESGQPWRGFDPGANGRHWQCASYLYAKYEQITGEKLNQFPLLRRLDELDRVGLIYWPSKSGGQPRYKQFLSDAPGVPLQDVWTDISPINSQAQERLGYPTQKPEALLERIIGASTDEGDMILDPFCGCGTAIAAAQHMQRQWIGIDITHLAVNLIKWRLSDGPKSWRADTLGPR